MFYFGKAESITTFVKNFTIFLVELNEISLKVTTVVGKKGNRGFYYLKPHKKFLPRIKKYKGCSQPEIVSLLKACKFPHYFRVC